MLGERFSETSMVDTGEFQQPFRKSFVLEDVSESMSWLVTVLESSFPGIEVRTASSIQEAGSVLRDFAPDIALVDLGLPDGDGLSIIKQLNRECPQCLSVVTTIFADDAHVFPALKAGARGYILKDQSRDQLVQMLQGIAAGHPPLSPSIARRVLGFFHQSVSPEKPEYHLTEREQEVLGIIAKGYSAARTADMLGISVNTVNGYIKEIYRKLNVSSRAEATLEASRLGLV